MNFKRYRFLKISNSPDPWKPPDAACKRIPRSVIDVSAAFLLGFDASIYDRIPRESRRVTSLIRRAATPINHFTWEYLTRCKLDSDSPVANPRKYREKGYVLRASDTYVPHLCDINLWVSWACTACFFFFFFFNWSLCVYLCLGVAC